MRSSVTLAKAGRGGRATKGNKLLILIFLYVIGLVTPEWQTFMGGDGLCYEKYMKIYRSELLNIVLHRNIRTEQVLNLSSSALRKI